MCESLLKREFTTYWTKYASDKIKTNKMKTNRNVTTFDTMTLHQLCDAKAYMNTNPPVDPRQSKISFASATITTEVAL